MKDNAQQTRYFLFNEYVDEFWHSEPRLLSLLRNDRCIPDFVSNKVQGIKGVKLIVLHIHSRYDI